MASVQEKAQQVRVSCSVVGSSAGNLCEPVLINLCVFQLRFQVGLYRYLPFAAFKLNDEREVI